MPSKAPLMQLVKVPPLAEEKTSATVYRAASSFAIIHFNKGNSDVATIQPFALWEYLVDGTSTDSKSDEEKIQVTTSASHETKHHCNLKFPT